MLKSAESAGYMLTVACEGGIVVTERDGHAIARISPGATFGECLGCGLELIWMNFVSFFLQTKTDMDIYIYIFIFGYFGYQVSYVGCLSGVQLRLVSLSQCNSVRQSCCENPQERAVTIRAVMLAC